MFTENRITLYRTGMNKAISLIAMDNTFFLMHKLASSITVCVGVFQWVLWKIANNYGHLMKARGTDESHIMKAEGRKLHMYILFNICQLQYLRHIRRTIYHEFPSRVSKTLRKFTFKKHATIFFTCIDPHILFSITNITKGDTETFLICY